MMSIGRRMALKALMGTPFVAKAAATEAADKALSEAFGVGVNESPPVGIPPPESCPITDLFYKEFYDKQESQGLHQNFGIPSHIADKKSWSASFKQKAARDDWRKRQPPNDLKGKLKWLIENKVLPKECL